MYVCNYGGPCEQGTECVGLRALVTLEDRPTLIRNDLGATNELTGRSRWGARCHARIHVSMDRVTWITVDWQTD